jgi:cytochrome c-type biogenesis protein CcmE
MAKGHIIALVVIAVAISMIITTFGDASEYVTFREAFSRAKGGNTGLIHVVGTLKKDAQGKILETYYNPAVNPNLFTFTLIDTEKEAQKVTFKNPKPTDFDRSEQIVVIGRVVNNEFIAEKILMKCPSKYQENKLETKEASAKKISLQ